MCSSDLPLFKTQLRAILRAAVEGDVRVMFPLVSNLLELRQARMILGDVMDDLEEQKVPFRRDVPVGIMVEVPAAVMLAEELPSPDCDPVRVHVLGERLVALQATEAMVREIAKTYPHAELMDTWTWFQSGINTDGAHNPVTSKTIERGDILSLNCFPMIAGYYTALERTLFCESASPRHLELWQINCAVHRRGLELIRPGARCCDIAAELNEMYEEHGLLEYRSFGYGHSFGVLCHYYGREAGLELREDIETVLEPGMVVSMEPMIMIPEGMPGAGGYREHDILVITEDGADNITEIGRASCRERV